MDPAPGGKPAPAPPLVAMIGVSGSGKSKVGRALADRLDVAFREGDDFHPDANVAKMRAGVPLDDRDREPWLRAIADWIGVRTARREGGVVSCSALRRAYRDRLRASGGAALRMVLLDPPESTLRARLAKRQGHFMPASLLDSQLATLEAPTPDEHVLELRQDESVATLVARIAAFLEATGVRPVGCCGTPDDRSGMQTEPVGWPPVPVRT